MIDPKELDRPQHKVICVIPSMGANLSRLGRCIDSAKDALPSGGLIVVAWNSRQEFPLSTNGFEVYLPGMNLGYGPAINVVASRYPSDYLWLVQDDMQFPDAYLMPFIEAMEADPSLAVITPGVERSASRGGFKPRGGAITASGDLVSGPSNPRVLKLRTLEVVERDWVQLSGAVVRSSHFHEIGGFDPAYFPIGHSDVDLCWRLRQRGFRVTSALNYSATHQKGGSTPSLLGHYLFEAHGAYFKRKVQGQLDDLSSIDVPPEILQAIAIGAGDKLVGLARFASSNRTPGPVSGGGFLPRRLYAVRKRLFGP